MFRSKIKFIILFYGIYLLTGSTNIAACQTCSGHWAVGTPLNWGCLVGVGLNLNDNFEPTGCPTNPNYTSLQTNTFIFDNPENTFSIDFRGFSTVASCARLEIKVNGLFYPLTSSNVVDIPVGLGCAGSFSYITVTNDGYITNTATGVSNGHGRIVISGVIVTSVSISANDPAGTVVSTPFNCSSVVPVELENFTGTTTTDCKALLNWKTATEFNVKNIEIQGSDDGIIFSNVAQVFPKGSDSNYLFTIENLRNQYFRLKINDLDGNFEFSEIIYIKSTCTKNNYAIVPNPGINNIEIIGLKNTDNVLVSDITGRIVFVFNAPLNNKINIHTLAAGIYFFQVSNDGITKAVLKVIKN